MTNLNQIWVPIKDFPNYEINIIGEVRRINNSTRGKAGYLLKSFIHTKGYKSIRLRNKGLSKTFRIHRLVAEAYLPNPKQMPQVNHINGIKTDNHISNLEWCDNSYNQRHSYNVLNKRPGMLGITGLKNKKTIKLQCTAIGQYYTLNTAALFLNVGKTTIHAMLTGKIKNWSNFIYA
jgi:hypothetical protein